MLVKRHWKHTAQSSTSYNEQNSGVEETFCQVTYVKGPFTLVRQATLISEQG